MRRFLAVGRPVIPCATALILTLATTPLDAQTGASGAPPSRGVAPATATACTVREASRSPLVVDDTREMYVEPMVVLPSRGEILLAGSPNYLYAPGGPDEPRDFVRDSVFGAILGTDGRARLIAAPIDPTRITSVHAAALPAGGWAVVFAELKHQAVAGTPDSLVRFWHAVHDGRSWTHLDQLPVPSDGAFLKAGASDLILRADTSFFAARVAMRNGSHDVALFEHRQGRWMLDMIPARSAAYVQLGYADSLGL